VTFDARAALEELAARAAIHDVILRYARGIDRRDFDLVAACFAAHATVDYGDFFRGEVGGLIAAMAEGLAGFPTTMHLMGNHLVELDGDRATSETYAVAYHRRTSAPQPFDLTTGVRYLDELAREDGRWRITRRVVKYEWRREDAVTG
jgi:hypothetical protein